jgi:predicted glycosyl hydrolase (DUF1957 family)
MIKDLYDTEKVELTSCGAYHPILTKLPEDIVEQEIILNEYGLGYYLGKNKGFEGEEAILLKNIRGFFPPELAVSQKLLVKLDQLGYAWVAIDEASLSEQQRKSEATVYTFDDLKIKAVKRNRDLSNALSFKRDTNVSDLVNHVLYLRQEVNEVVIAMDGEFFGHHFEEGIYLFDTLVDALSEVGIEFTTVSELISKAQEHTIDGINEATWGVSDQDLKDGNLYPLWDAPDNEIQRLQWELVAEVIKVSNKENTVEINNVQEDALKTFPIWDLDRLNTLTDVNFKNAVFKNILLLQSLNSDQFWWASQQNVGGKEMFDAAYINKSLDMFYRLATIIQDDSLINFVEEKSGQIRSLL